MLLRISAPYFVAGAIVKNETIVHAAPILKYTVGWSQFKFLNHCRGKGWKIEVVK